MTCWTVPLADGRGYFSFLVKGRYSLIEYYKFRVIRQVPVP
jgi:hypothetical protein